TQRWLAYIVLGALILVFAAWGAYGIVDIGFGPPNYAAKADGERISIEDASRAWQRQQVRLQQMYGGDIPAARRGELQNEVLEGLISNALLTRRAHDSGYRVSDELLADAVKQIPAFQINGKYSLEAAKGRLAQEGLTAAGFEAELRVDLARAQIQNGIRLSDFLTPTELARAMTLEDEQREVRYALFPAEKFADAAKIDDQAVQDYYTKHRADFMTSESVRLAYAELRLDQLAAQGSVSDQDLQALYAKSKDKFVVPERRRARHILIAVNDPKDDAAAHKQADEVMAEAKSGKDFAELAKKYSKDSGSAVQGGDLGWLERSYFVGSFADALFAMKEGELRGPVKTQFGYHIIRLDGIQPGKTKTFEEARGELEAQLRKDRASDTFGDRQEQIQTRLEQPGSTLESIAKEFSLATGEVAAFARATGGAPLGSSPELQEVVFGDAVLNQHKVGGPVAMGEDRLVLVRVLEHHKSEPKPLADVRAAIRATLQKEQGTRLAADAAQAAAKRLDAGETFDAVAKSLGVSAEPAKFVGRGDPSIPAQIRELVFNLPKPAGKPLVRAIALESNGGAAVVAVTAVRSDAASGNPQLRAQRAQDLAGRGGSAAVEAYIDELRRQAKVDKNPKAFE
ncbi:MAG TPA: peptidyl-prolyl cis-trans isomerase, partial [Steroidobacteraceae bacterium]